MQVIITENERGILYKNGAYMRMLSIGKHRVWPQFGERVYKFRVDEPIDHPDVNLSVLRGDPEFEKNAVVAEVPEDSLALLFADGRIIRGLGPGEYAYWNIYKKHTFEIIDITKPDLAINIPVLYMMYIAPSYYIKVEINDGEIGLLFFNGVYQRNLEAGQYYFWNYIIKVTVQVVDTRIQQLDISGQEILTADKVSIRLNFVCSYKITDPLNIVTKLKDYKTQLHVLVQLVLREFTSKFRFDELLRQKDSLGSFILEKLKERESDFYLQFFDAGIKDIILPGEIRDIMNTVLIAEKAAQASVITRREETAATKSLLDTAKLMDENATLYKLKELEYLERICEKVGSISVGASDGIINNLRALVSSRA